MLEHDSFTNNELTQSTIKAILLMLVTVIIMGITFFAAAGRFDIPRAWFYFSAMLVYFVVSVVILYRCNPVLLIHRLKRKADAKQWDNILMRVINLIGTFGVVAVIGLDIGRYKWSCMSNGLAVLGWILWIISNILVMWSMAVNPVGNPATNSKAFF